MPEWEIVADVVIDVNIIEIVASVVINVSVIIDVNRVVLWKVACDAIFVVIRSVVKMWFHHVDEEFYNCGL